MTSPARITLALCLPVLGLTAGAYALGDLTLRAPEALFGLGTGLLAIGAGTLLPVVAASRAVTTPSVRRWLLGAADPVVATGAITLVATLGTVASAVLTPWGGPPADSLLSWPEVALGYTQADAWEAAARAGVLPELAVIYASPALQLKAACLWWVAIGQDSRPIWSATIALAICVLVGLPVYLVAPAEGPAVWYGHADPGSWHEAWTAMRAGPCTVDRLFGLVASPSYHIAFVVLLTRLWAGTPFQLAAWVINAAMVLATLVIGEHYGADVVLGALLVAGACCASDLMLDGWAHQGREVARG